MDIRDKKLTEFLANLKEVQVIIPIYQREYKWEWKTEVKRLIKDIENAGKSIDPNYEYFLGTLIVKVKDKVKDYKYIIVDGQQRITTFLLIYLAIRDILDILINNTSNTKNKEEIESNLREIERIIGKNEYIKDGIHLKSHNDIHKLEMIYKKDIPKNDKSQLVSNYREIKKYLKNKITKTGNASFLLLGLKKMVFALIELNEIHDEGDIFETINSTGKKLSFTDLIKNYVVNRVGENYATRVEQKVFDPLDNNITDFFRQIFAIKTGRLITINAANGTKNNGYVALKDMVRNEVESSEKEEKIVLENMVTEWVEDYKIWEFIHNDLISHFSEPKFELLLKGNLLNFYSVVHVLIKNNYYSFIENNNVGLQQYNEIKQYLECIVRTIVKIVISNTGRVEKNRSWPTIAKVINEHVLQGYFSTPESIANELETTMNKIISQSLENIKQNIETLPVYQTHKSNLKYIFAQLEYMVSKRNVLNHEKAKEKATHFTIEHIFPQEPGKKRKEWIESIGEEDFEKLKNDYVDTLGNLTLADQGLNSYLSNNVFSKKIEKIEEQGYLKINKSLSMHDKWDANVVSNRSKNLLDKIIKNFEIKPITNIISNSNRLKKVFAKVPNFHDMVEGVYDLDTKHLTIYKDQEYDVKVRDSERNRKDFNRILNKLEKEKVISFREKEDVFSIEFLKEYEFASSSSAGIIVAGGQVNGLTFWKHQNNN